MTLWVIVTFDWDGWDAPGGVFSSRLLAEAEAARVEANVRGRGHVEIHERILDAPHDNDD